MASWNTKGKDIGYNEVKRNWFVMLSIEGFESVMLMYGTQSELWHYMRNSFHYSIHYRYRVASDEEVTAARMIGVKAYIC